MTHPPDQRRPITAPEAQTQLGVPASSVRAWASKGRLYAVGIDKRGRKLYRLEDVLALRDATRRRTRHARPARAATESETSP